MMDHLSGQKQRAEGGKARSYFRILAPGGLAVALFLVMLGMARAQQVHRNGFEGRTASWGKGPSDAGFKETAHDVTDQTAHTGQLSEHIALTAEQGSYIHYIYPTARAPIGEELAVRLWLKGNRPGMQLNARIVLPKERNPENLNEPLTAMLRGDQYQLVGRWQALELRRPIKLAREQQQLMRAELKRDIDFTDAYIDRLVLNVYGGPGQTEVWIDDLEIGPVLEDKDSPKRPEQPLPVGPTAAEPKANAPAARHAAVELNQDRLMINGKRFLFRGIRHSDTPLKVLREAGFNTIWLDASATPNTIDEAASMGFWLVPTLSVDSNDQNSCTPDALERAMAPFKDNDAVLWWDLGGGKMAEDVAFTTKTARAVKSIDNTHPMGADVWDGFTPYSRNLDLLGAHRWPLGTAMELTQYRDWLAQRRLLARPGTFMWTWIQTHLPVWYTSLVYNRKPEEDDQRKLAQAFDEPIGPQPEQIRLLTYLALSAGCHGLGYWSDRYLADSHYGRDRLLQLALLNHEMQLLEPLLLASVEPPGWIDTSIPEVKAAVMRTERGILVLPMWLGKGSQYVPGQSAAAKLTVIVPQAPAGTQAWEVTAGDIRSLRVERVTGGTKVTIPEFGLTTAVVFTSDNSPTGTLVWFQEQTRKTRRQAAQWMHDLALAEIEKVLKVEDELEKAGHVTPDAQALKDDAQSRLKASRDFWTNGDYRQAYAEAQRALRPLRILMRAQWELATRQLDIPVASPYAVSFYTLPRHWQFMQQVQGARVGPNMLPDGSFEVTPDQAPNSWLPQEVTLDDVELAAWRVGDDPRDGRRCLKLEVKPKNKETPPGALERTFLAINSPAVKLQPGTLVRISGWLKVPQAITASADGVLLYDSAAGEPLAVRVTGATPWKKYTLYRRVPETGTINVTLALTGIGSVYFDDVRIETLTAVEAPPQPAPAAPQVQPPQSPNQPTVGTPPARPPVQ